MKRKPSFVSVVLFIILFVIFYFLEQQLHIFTNVVNTSADIEVNTMHIGKVEADFVVSIFKTIFQSNIIY